MESEGVSGVAQSQLAAVLRYFGHGDFAKFSRAAEIVFGAARVKEPYFCADMLFAFQIAGLCEISNATGVTHWWVSHCQDIRVNSMSPKQIGATLQWFAEHEKQTVALITDQRQSALVLGSLCADTEVGSEYSMFNRPFVNLVPRFTDIEHQLCVEVPFTDELFCAVEIFDPNAGCWNEAAPSQIVGSQLIRMRKEYSGFAYYVQHSTFGLRFKITQPEWAFVVAYHTLPWRLSNILKVDGEYVCVNRAVRLPAVLYRTLFAACKMVRIGPVVTFDAVDSRCIRGVLNYFDAVGERT